MRVIAMALVLMLGAALMPQPASAQVDTWRVLHIGLQSGASVDTDGDGVVNSWKDCRQRGNSGKQHCKSIEHSSKYQMWQADMTCFEQSVEAWTDYQIDIVQDQVFIETDAYVPNWPYEMAAAYGAEYNFDGYDSIMVWTGYTQALGFDGGAWGPTVSHWSYVALYGLAGHCAHSVWPANVPGHEFTHNVIGLYHSLGFPVCPGGVYGYAGDGLPDVHHRLLTNTYTPNNCVDVNGNAIVSTGVPPEAYASGSYLDHYA